MAQAQAAFGGDHPELGYQRVQHVRQRDVARLGQQAARLEPRHVEQSGQQVGGVVEGAADLPRQLALFTRAALRQCIGEQVRGMQRLQEVVPDRREEAALGIVGVFGFALGGFEQGGALDHALLQGLVAALELCLGLAERGDVGEGGHEAAAGHRIAADLDDAAIGEHALGQV